MAKRYFDISATELRDWDCNMSLDEGIGVGNVTRDLRVIWQESGGTRNNMDIYTAHATDVNHPRSMSQATLSIGAGSVSGILRVVYEDTHGLDLIVGGIRAIREELQARGRGIAGVDIFGDAQVQDDVIAALRLAESAFGSRGRAEGHCAANS